MTQLTAVELADMQSAIEDLLPDTCNILSKTRTSNGQGGYTHTYGTVTAGVACRFDRIPADEKVTADAIQPYSRFMLTLPHDATITSASLVESGGLTYNVVSGPNTGVSWLGCKRCVVEKVRT